METLDMPTNKVHEGRNLKRIREILRIKQEVLAEALGMSQQSVSLLESKEIIEPELLEQAAKVLKVPVEAIKNFNEDAAYNVVGNTVTNNDNVAFFQYNPTFNPLDKVVELYERIIKEKDALIEKLSQDKPKK